MAMLLVHTSMRLSLACTYLFVSVAQPRDYKRQKIVRDDVVALGAHLVNNQHHSHHCRTSTYRVKDSTH